MDALILAGGLGTRLAPVVSRRAKSVAPVAGRPFLGHLLDHLARSREIRRAILCVGHLADTVEASLGTRHGRLALAYSREEAPLGTGGALRHAIRGFDLAEPVLALNGDCYFGLRVDSLLAFHRRTRPLATIAVLRVPDCARYGTVRLAGPRVAAFEEKAGTGPAWVSAGWYVLSGPALAQLRAMPRAFSLERESLSAWGAAGALGAYRSRARFVDIGTPEDYERAGRIVPARRRGAR